MKYKFVDEVTVLVRSGHGGAGCVAFRREKYAEFGGPGYGVVTDGSREALQLVARNEGLVLDPCYTGKAMAGLLAHGRAGWWTADHTAVFVHTGGTPALFAYAGELGLELGGTDDG